MKGERDRGTLGWRILQSEIERSRVSHEQLHSLRDVWRAGAGRERRQGTNKTHHDNFSPLDLPLPPPVAPQSGHRPHHRAVQQVSTVRERVDRYPQVQNLWRKEARNDELDESTTRF